MSFLNTIFFSCALCALACVGVGSFIKHLFARFFSKKLRFSTHIAPIHVDDAQGVAYLHSQGFAQGWDVLEFQNLLCDRHIFAHGLFSTDRFLSKSSSLVGFVLSRRVLDEAEILTITLALAMRGQKLSATLLKPHLEALSHNGVREVFLEVSEHNHPAIQLYQRFGFEKIGRREAYYRDVSGQLAAALTMRVTL